MSDERRAKLDIDVENFIDSCVQKLKILQSEIILDKGNQFIEHRQAVLRIVRRILNDIVAHFNYLKTTKISREMEKKTFDRIECSSKLAPGQSIDDDEVSLHEYQHQSVGDDEVSLDECQHQSLLAAEHHTSIDPVEIQALALENSQIHDELITLDDEVRSIGKKVVQISKLQELFTEKVMEQTVDLNSLHETAIRSSENVREGNDLIREAMMKNASTRVFILFYIVTLGFTILFLDWYNP
jgi:syntaxin 18